jgi:hypothetical protein
MVLVEGADHTFSTFAPQRFVLETVTQHPNDLHKASVQPSILGAVIHEPKTSQPELLESGTALFRSHRM